MAIVIPGLQRLMAFCSAAFSSSSSKYSSTVMDRFYGHNAEETWVEVYLICNQLKKRWLKNSIPVFFQKGLENIQGAVLKEPVFFNEEQAMHYIRFKDKSYSILKAYVPESAIEASSDVTMVKENMLYPQFIHGCYPGWLKTHEYFENPHFDFRLVELNHL